MNRLFAIVILALAIFAGGCAHCPLCGGEWKKRGGAGADGGAAAPDMVKVEGTVTCYERIPMVAIYKIVITLRDAQSGEVIASEEYHPMALPEFFSLQYNRKLLRAGRIYELSAELRSKDNSTVLFSTDTPYPLPAYGSAIPVDMALTRAR